MKTEKAIKRIEKYLGTSISFNGRKFEFDYDGRVGSFYDDNGEACSFHIRRVDDHSCLATDYFAGYFLKNATQFMHALKPPPPKFANGTLIRGKDNKRAQRWGIAGKVGVVIDTTNYGGYNILWNGQEEIHTYTYERDLEAVK